MPKRVGYIYDRMKNKNFIRSCILKSAENKHHRWDVITVLDNLELYVDKVYDMICNYEYVPTPVIHKKIYDLSGQKWREIGVQPFYPDGIMQQCAVTAMKDVLMRGMYQYSCASIPGRGTKYALCYEKRIIQHHSKKSKYVAELDIKQFYPSIPQKQIIIALERKIKDKRFLALVAVIISGYTDGLKIAIEKGLTSLEIVGELIGIEIGYYINQWLSNYLLETIDRYILSYPGVKGLCRYADNINIFSSNKRKLHRMVKSLKVALNKFSLTIKENWQIYPINARPLSSVGFKISRTYITMRKRNFLRLKRKANKILKKIKNHQRIPHEMARSMLSHIGQLKYCNSLKIKQKYIFPIGIKRLRNIVSVADRANNILL